MKSGTESKAKFKKLQRRLRLSLWQTIGLLEALWQVTARDCPCGDIGRLSNEDIAATIEWDQDEDELVASLVACGWLDECDEHRLVVHDWHVHAPNFIKANVARMGLAFASTKSGSKNGSKSGSKSCSKSGSKSGSKNAIPSLANPSEANPSQAQPIQAQPSRIALATEAAFLSVTRFADFQEAYPKQGQAKPNAIFQAYREAVLSLVAAGDCDDTESAESVLIESARQYVAARRKARRPPALPGAERWLIEETYRAPPEAWSRDLDPPRGGSMEDILKGTEHL